MKLFVTILLLCCSLLIQERGLASVRAPLGIVHRTTTRSMTLSAPTSNIFFEELSWCDDDDDNDDNEFNTARKKTQAFRIAQKPGDLIFITDEFTRVITNSLPNGIYSLPSADICIFQRALRV